MPHLILHKVRGEAAFDIATPMEVGDEVWWIIPTSGHRAYPHWYMPMEDILADYNIPTTVPPDLRDHYTVLNPPAAKRQRVDDEPRAEDL